MKDTQNGLRRLWRPGGEALETIAGVLSERWRAAAHLSPSRLFWQAPARWLKSGGARISTLKPHHFTTGGKLIK